MWFVDSTGHLRETAIPETTIDKQLTKVCRALEPRDLTEKHFGVLNGLEELNGIPACPLPKEMQERKDKKAKKSKAGP